MKAILTLVVAGFFPVLTFAQIQPGAIKTNPEYAAILTNAPPRGFATRLDYVKSFTKEREILAAYHAEKLNKGEALIALLGLGDQKSMDTYGKVIDQDGQPVEGATVRGSINVSGDFIEHYTKTDARGRFDFLGLHGKGLVMNPKKESYIYDGMLRSERPNDYLPDSNNLLVFVMYKLRGAEEMVHADTKGLPYWYSFLKPNQNAAHINLMTCRDAKHSSEKKPGMERRYDLEVALQRGELIRTNANKSLFCDWSVIIGITNGGLVEVATNIVYPYEAPLEGYQPSVRLNFPTNMAGWTDKFRKQYFFKSENGKTYGRMSLEIDNKGRLSADIYANPAGSRNLEFDPNKQIMR